MPGPGSDRFTFRLPASEFSENLDLELSVTPVFFTMEITNLPFQDTVQIVLYVESESKGLNDSSAYFFIRQSLNDYAPILQR